MIYFDNSATTFVDPKVLETFNKVCTEYPGNSNSIHSLGVKSKELEEYATEKIARLLNVKPSEIIYTSGASESNNTVLKGVASRYKNRGNHIITTHLEHSSTIETVKYLESKGFIIDYVKINKDGLIDLDNLKELINDKTILVAISYVDSELGIKQNIKEIKKIINNYPKCYFHVDATQAIGKIKVDFNDMDFMSMSGHKIFGMKGIGLLIKKDNIVIDNVDNYAKLLEENFVILDQNRREEIIRFESKKIARSLGGEIKENKDLLEELVYIVEYPTPIKGTIKKEFLILPKEVITTTMIDHLRYTPIYDDKGELLPYFITIRNGNHD